MSEFRSFIADQKSEKFITYNKIRQANLLQVKGRKKNEKRKVKYVLFSSAKRS